MMSGVRLSVNGLLNLRLISSPAMTSSMNSAPAFAFRYAATAGVWLWSGNQIRKVARLVDLHGVDRRLAVLGTDDEQSRIKNVLPLKRIYHGAQRLVGLLQAIGKNVGRRSGAILVTARLPIQLWIYILNAAAVLVVLCQLLPHANGLEIHPEHCRHARTGRSVVFQAMDFVNDRVNFFLIVCHRADHAGSCIESVHVGDFRREEVLDALAGRTIHQVVGRVLVSPGGVATRASDDFEDRVAPDRIMRKHPHTLAILVQPVREGCGINDIQRDGWVARVLVNALVENHRITGLAGAGSVGRIEYGSIVANVVKDPVRDG